MSTATPTRTALRGDLLDFVDAPVRADIDSPAVRFRADHWLLIDDGVIAGATARCAGQPPGSASIIAAS